MLTIFQIGYVRTFSNLRTDKTALNANTSIESTAIAQSIPWSGNKVFGFTTDSFVTPDIVIKDVFINSEYGTQYQREAQYKTLLMQPYVDIFAYRWDYSQDSNIDTRDDAAFDSFPVWFHTIGQVKKINPNYTEETIEITLSIRPRWEPVNRFVWKYRQRLGDNEVKTPALNAVDDLNSVPFKPVVERLESGFFTRQKYDDPLYSYNPNIWEYWHLRLPPGYPSTGYGRNWTADTVTTFYKDYLRWSGATRSSYMWRLLPPSGSILMENQYEDPLLGSTTETNTISLDLLNQNLEDAGYGGLLTTDYLVIDEYLGKRSFIIRDQTVLLDVYPIWTYSGNTLGSTGTGLNVIRMYYNMPDTYVPESAQLHIFGVV